MRNTRRQILFGLALVAPVVCAVLFGSPFVAEPVAQGAGGGGMVGPLAPVLAGGVGFYPQPLGGGNYLVDTPWNCDKGDGDDTFQFSGGPPYTTAARDNGLLHQEASVSGFTGGFPTSFHFWDTGASFGNGGLNDTNADGVYDTFLGNGQTLLGGPVNVSLAFQLMDNNRDGNPDHISVPWAEVNALGWLDPTDGCNDTEPQAWVPLADTNGDGKPDSIVFDLDGNGAADPQFYTSPPLVPAAVPSVNWSGLALLAVLLGSLACWALARRQTLSEA